VKRSKLHSSLTLPENTKGLTGSQNPMMKAVLSHRFLHPNLRNTLIMVLIHQWNPRGTT